jgi:hypothetical protein
MMERKTISSRESTDPCILRWPTPRSKNWTTALLESADRDKNIIAIVAAGSAVRPHVPSVDLDLLVICKDVADFDRRSPIEVDLRVYAETQVDKCLRKGHDLLNWAVKFGRVLYQRGNYWDELVKSWRHHLPLPSPKVARERAIRTARHLANVIQSGDVDAAREQALTYLTHVGRAELLDRGIYPASRPELPGQLRMIGSSRIAEFLDRILSSEALTLTEIEEVLRPTS